jgi:hypothetical protein
MYARVAAFENRDASRVDDLIATIKERSDAGQGPPDVKRVLMLVDREAGTALGITFFETEDAIRRAEPAFERMGDEIPEELRGRRASVETYEALIDEVAEGARAARVSSLEGSSDRIDEGVRFLTEQIIPAAGDISGWRGVVLLADRAAGKTKTITFWDGIESLTASEERADELRSEAAAAMDETITGVDRYEVAVSRVLAPTPA